MPMFDITVDATISRFVRLFFDEVEAPTREEAIRIVQDRGIDPDWIKEWYCEESYRADPQKWDITEVEGTRL